MSGWTKVDPEAYARSMAIIAAGPKEGESSRDLIDRANAEVGIFSKRRAKSRIELVAGVRQD